jgi:hypothetical protein
MAFESATPARGLTVARGLRIWRLDKRLCNFDIGRTIRVPLRRNPFAIAAAAVILALACSGCGSSSGTAAKCSSKLNVVLWGGIQWLELGKALAADRSGCAEYYVTIPPQDSDKTRLRGRDFKKMRALGTHIHPVAEIRFTGETGWQAWVKGPHRDFEAGRTFYDAGVEARRRMAERGLDVGRGEVWALNELTEDVLENKAGSRMEIREFLRGLYEGAEGMPKARGIVFNIGVPSDVSDASAYKEDLKAWLTDEAFWNDMDTYVDFFADEVYGNPANWGVAGMPLEQRTERLNEFLFHTATLAEGGPENAGAARDFFERSFVALGNAAWPHPGIGHTDVISAETMGHFIAAQVHAMRGYAEAHEGAVPEGTIGFAWAPNRDGPGYSKQGVHTILAQLVRAIGGASQEGGTVCGAGDDACAGDVDGARVNNAWRIFASWD